MRPFFFGSAYLITSLRSSISLSLSLFLLRSSVRLHHHHHNAIILIITIRNSTRSPPYLLSLTIIPIILISLRSSIHCVLRHSEALGVHVRVLWQCSTFALALHSSLTSWVYGLLGHKYPLTNFRAIALPRRSFGHPGVPSGTQHRFIALNPSSPRCLFFPLTHPGKTRSFPSFLPPPPPPQRVHCYSYVNEQLVVAHYATYDKFSLSTILPTITSY